MSLRINQYNLNRQQLISLSFKQADIEDYGIGWEGPAPSEAWNESVVIPQTSVPFSLETYVELAWTIDPCQYSEFQGVDVYIQTLTIIERIH